MKLLTGTIILIVIYGLNSALYCPYSFVVFMLELSTRLVDNL